MNLVTSVPASALVTAAILLIAPLWSQSQPKYTAMEVETIHRHETDDPVLRTRFNYDRPFAISINQKIANARVLRNALVESLGRKGLLDIIVFEWFGQAQPQAIEVNIGVNVPLEISQSVLRMLSKEKALPLIVSLESQDKDMANTQRVYVGSLVKSEGRPVLPSKLNALLNEKISREEFFRIAAAHE
jgi:hypothetical protein